MNSMNLPKRSTEKPKWKGAWKDNGPCINHLNQQFNPTTPNSVWASDFTYIHQSKWKIPLPLCCD